MAAAFKCDKCGEKFDGVEYGVLKLSKYNPSIAQYGHVGTYELCQECFEKIRKELETPVNEAD